MKLQSQNMKLKSDKKMDKIVDDSVQSNTQLKVSIHCSTVTVQCGLQCKALNHD